ncbi:hypothetical protein Naga_102602g1 [Nannochloropsis gaditana]|uniref:Uncharacterized protein n=1 Tax=Nannochloropsis gaditana TaxID=72520 RepID=W7TNY3_9STRA|nr:hypothetical protein Naga_102602g1 [Nannochloropsis gaditana]
MITLATPYNALAFQKTVESWADPIILQEMEGGSTGAPSLQYGLPLGMDRVLCTRSGPQARREESTRHARPGVFLGLPLA